MTSSTVINGKVVAASILETVKAAALALETENGVKTGLAVIIVGDDPASHAYVAAKSRMATECGFASFAAYVASRDHTGRTGSPDRDPECRSDHSRLSRCP